MIKYFCDRCDSEITEKPTPSSTTPIYEITKIMGVGMRSSISLCANCQADLSDFIENVEPEEPEVL